MDTFIMTLKTHLERIVPLLGYPVATRPHFVYVHSQQKVEDRVERHEKQQLQ